MLFRSKLTVVFLKLYVQYTIITITNRRGVCSGGMCAWTQEGRVEDALSAGSDAEGGKF